MTRCTICSAATHGHDDDDEAWCRYCFDHYILRQEARVPRVLRPQAPVWTREALLVMQHQEEEAW